MVEQLHTPSTYNHVNSDYLNMAGKQLQNYKVMSYELMHIKPGHHVLDVGCGPAIDTIPLSQFVGNKGQVIGIDNDPEMIAIAKQKTTAAELNHIVIHETHDATRLPYADNTFDSCRIERVLQHLVDPEKAIAELIRVTKPGGHIVIADTDWGSMAYCSSIPHIEAKIHNAYRHKFALNPLMGRQLYQMMHKANLVNVKTHPLIFLSHDYHMMNYMMLLESKLKIVGLEGGYFNQEEYDQFIVDLKKLDAEGNFFGYICGFITVGQKQT